MSVSSLLSKSVFFVLFLVVHHVTCMTIVEGYVGESVTLPCNLTGSKTLDWYQGDNLILVKLTNGGVNFGNGSYNGDVSLVNGTDLRINSLNRNRDGDTGTGVKTFKCGYTGEGYQEIQLTLLARITGVSIPEAINGIVTVTAGTPKTVNCSVTGDPIPEPSFRWSVNDADTGQTLNTTYTFTPDTSTRTIKCTAFNRYLNGTVISEAAATATLNVQYLDAAIPHEPVIVIENFKATLRCSVTGNPPPSYEWRRSTGSANTISQSDVYTIENVQRSAAGEYTCIVRNIVNSTAVTVNLIVQYDGASGAKIEVIVGAAAGGLMLVLIIIILIIVIRRRSANTKHAEVNNARKPPKKDDGRENDAFSDDRWKQPDAEIAVNEFYGAFPSNAQSTGSYPAPKSAKPGKNSRNNGPPVQSRRDAELKPEAYDDMSAYYATVQKKSPAKNSNQEKDAGIVPKDQPVPVTKKKGLNYQEVAFDTTSKNPKAHPKNSLVTYADISVMNQNADSDSPK